MRLSNFLALGSLVLTPLCQMVAAPVAVSNIYAFGDSLSDTGNAYILSGGVFPGANYATGEYTDGPNTTPATTGPQGLWVQQLAPKLGVAAPAPFFTPGQPGTNFAVASAHAVSDQTVSVPAELALFSATIPTGAPASGLYTVWAGANDIFDALGTGMSATAGKTAADSLAASISALALAGGKNFLWLNLPPLGETPFGLASGFSTYLNQQAADFNSEWQAQLYGFNALASTDPGLQVIGVDVNNIFEQVAANYAAGCTVAASNPYCFANIGLPAQGQTGVNPDTFLYWDAVHPTTAADALIADLAASDLAAAPEPQAMALGILGLVMLGGAALRRKKNSLAKN